MKKKIYLTIALALLILGLAAYSYFKAVPGAKNNQSSPKIEIAPLSFDFGEINFGTIAKQSFIIKNTGSEILEIKRVATSCACTTAKVSQEKITPGQEAELLVTYDTAAMGSGPHGRNRQERIIYVKSNDPANPQVEVIIDAFVK